MGKVARDHTHFQIMCDLPGFSFRSLKTLPRHTEILPRSHLKVYRYYRIMYNLAGSLAMPLASFSPWAVLLSNNFSQACKSFFSSRFERAAIFCFYGNGLGPKSFCILLQIFLMRNS